jgi:hypothetical protein
MNNINFEEDQAKVIHKTENIRSLADQVERLQNLQQDVEKSEEDLKQKKKDLEHISGEVIPTREAAFNWLRNNGLGDIIKNEILVSFGRNEDNKAADYAALAQERGFQPTQKLTVAPMTLKALVRERIEAGKDMPTELFNVFVGNKTTIKRKQ